MSVHAQAVLDSPEQPECPVLERRLQHDRVSKGLRRLDGAPPPATAAVATAAKRKKRKRKGRNETKVHNDRVQSPVPAPFGRVPPPLTQYTHKRY